MAPKVFEVIREPGLTGLLIGANTLGDVMNPNGIASLAFIPAGTAAPNPAEVVGGSRMRRWLEPVASARVLVTGATGLVGAHLIPLLLERGYRVRALTHTRARKATHPPLEWMEIDDLCAADWPHLLANVDAVVHLAARAHVEAYNDADAAEFHRVNSEGTRLLVEAVARAPSIKRVVYVSSLAVFGAEGRQTITEASRCQPKTAYGRSKLDAEAHVRRTLSGSATSWVVLRPALVHGPGNPGNMAHLLRAIESRIPLPFAGVRNRRSFLFVGNLADALEVCLRSPGAANQTFVIADQPALSTPDLISKIAQAAGQRVPMLPVPLPILWVMARVADVVFTALKRRARPSAMLSKLTGSLPVDAGRIRAELNWQPPVSQDEALQITVQSWRQGRAR